MLDKKNEQARPISPTEALRAFIAEAKDVSGPQGAPGSSCPPPNEVRRFSRTFQPPPAALGWIWLPLSRCRFSPGELFDTYRYKLSVNGGYHALAGFLTNVGSLSRIVAPVALDVKQPSAGDKKKARPKEGESTLDTDFQIQTYIAHPAAAAGSAAGGTFR